MKDDDEHGGQAVSIYKGNYKAVRLSARFLGGQILLNGTEGGEWRLPDEMISYRFSCQSVTFFRWQNTSELKFET